MKKILLTAVVILVVMSSYGQLNPQGSTYFLNPYLTNPAYAGVAGGWTLNGALTAQLTSFDGAPFMQAVTLDYGAKESKVGTGVIFYKENAGVIGKTSVKATYSYHLQMEYEDRWLDLGLSGGIQKEQIDFDKVMGDQEDQSLYDFNKRGAYIDGDFGIAYRSPMLTVQAVIPNLKRFFNQAFREVADRYLYMGSVAYRYNTYSEQQTTFTPMVMYRVIQHERNILDFGMNAELANGKLMATGIYHSTGSVSGGIGTVYNERLSILAQFTSNTSDLKNYSNGQFEIALKFRMK